VYERHSDTPYVGQPIDTAALREVASSLPDRAAEWEREEKRKRWQEKWREAEAAWRRIPAPARESLVVRVLAGRS
jgi:hypothetical protein